jgi:hypothetical protein
MKKFIFPLLLIGTVLALIFRALAKPAAVKLASSRASYEAIEAYVEKQMRRLKIPGVSLVTRLFTCAALAMPAPVVVRPTHKYLSSLARSPSQSLPWR